MAGQHSYFLKKWTDDGISYHLISIEMGIRRREEWYIAAINNTFSFDPQEIALSGGFVWLILTKNGQAS
jgi:hypothetical protein